MCIQIDRITVFMDPNAEKKYLMLEELGCVLRQLNSELPGMYGIFVLRPKSITLISYSCCTIKERFS